jgi:hypothetical protein
MWIILLVAVIVFGGCTSTTTAPPPQGKSPQAQQDIFIPAVALSGEWPETVRLTMEFNEFVSKPEKISFVYDSKGLVQQVVVTYELGVQMDALENQLSVLLTNIPSRKFSNELVTWKTTNGLTSWMLALTEDGQVELTKLKTLRMK